MNNQSYWQTTTKLPRYPSIKQDSDYDIVIIGGGMSGITLAYRLNNTNLKVALLEADRLASKTTGHTTGKITYLHSTICQDIKDTYNKSLAKAYLDSNYEALQEIKGIINRHRIDCDFFENSAYIMASDKQNVEMINKQITLFKEWGIEVLEDNSNTSMGLKHQAIFNPLKYLKGLLKYCNNIDIFEYSTVKDYTNNDQIVLNVNNCKITTKKVVWLTRYPINKQKAYFIKMIQERHHVFYEEGKSNGSSILDLTNNYSSRFVDLEHIITIKAGNEKSWYGQDTVPLRKIPYIGKINNNEYVGYAYNKWGMTLSHVASKLIFDLIMNNENKYVSLYKPNYGKYRNSMKEIKILINNNYQGMIKNRFFNNEVRRLDKGKGKIVSYHNRLLAVYKDNSGKLFYFSPYCPHLKCVVQFNETDNTWDCPCHGSTFDCYGHLISGPSTNDLNEY